jgi:hypothetical protein
MGFQDFHHGERSEAIHRGFFFSCFSSSSLTRYATPSMVTTFTSVLKADEAEPAAVGAE